MIFRIWIPVPEKAFFWKRSETNFWVHNFGKKHTRACKFRFWVKKTQRKLFTFFRNNMQQQQQQQQHQLHFHFRFLRLKKWPKVFLLSRMSNKFNKLLQIQVQTEIIWPNLIEILITSCLLWIWTIRVFFGCFGLRPKPIANNDRPSPLLTLKVVKS